MPVVTTVYLEFLDETIELKKWYWYCLGTGEMRHEAVIDASVESSEEKDRRLLF